MLQKVEMPAAAVGPATAALARILREYDEGRRRAFDRLLGRRYRPSPLRDELIRMAILDCQAGTPRRITDYRVLLAHLGSRPAVHEEVRRLVDAGLMAVEPGVRPRRGAVVRPTQRLVDWYAAQIPEIVGFLQLAMSSLAPSSKADVQENDLPENRLAED